MMLVSGLDLPDAFLRICSVARRAELHIYIAVVCAEHISLRRLRRLPYTLYRLVLSGVITGGTGFGHPL